MSLLADLIYCPTLLSHYYYHRLLTGKYGEAAFEKCGYPSPRNQAPPPAAAAMVSPCWWLHAVSVGEALAARTLIKAFAEEFPDWELRVSTTTATGREVAQNNFGAERVFYYPLDCSWMVRRALGRIAPSLVVLMELEVWPNFLAAAAARRIPVVVANTRITEKSARRFKRFHSLAARMLSQVTLWLCQSEEYAERLRSIGVAGERLRVVGSLKYDAVPTDVDPAVRSRYRALIGAAATTPVLVAGSTHRGEEAAVLSAFATLKREAFPALKLVLAPRHPQRLDEVEALASACGKVVRRSAIAADGGGQAPIILLDTMGELGKLYAAADAVFVGGSLIDHGGQNMMEPCGLARPTVMGPSCHNFAEAAGLLVGCRGLRQVSSEEALTAALRELLSDPEAAAAMGQRARAALRGQKGATGKSVQLLRAVIESSHGD